MNSSQQEPSVSRLPKGQFKCFQCRQLFAMKDGAWHAWKTMEVHLCKGCEIETRAAPERKKKGQH